MKILFVVAALLIAAPAQPVEHRHAASRRVSAADAVTLRGAAAITRVDPHQLLIAVDVADDDTPGDGVVDHLFRFWTDGELPPMNVISSSASVEYRGNVLFVVASDKNYALQLSVAGTPVAVAGGATDATGYVGYGLNHEIGTPAVRSHRVRYSRGGLAVDTIFEPTPVEEGSSGGSVTCDAGGRYATSCSVSDDSGSCSISCASGSYACCRKSKFYPSQSQSCTCIKY